MMPPRAAAPADQDAPQDSAPPPGDAPRHALVAALARMPAHEIALVEEALIEARGVFGVRGEERCYNAHERSRFRSYAGALCTALAGACDERYRCGTRPREVTAHTLEGLMIECGELIRSGWRIDGEIARRSRDRGKRLPPFEYWSALMVAPGREDAR